MKVNIQSIAPKYDFQFSVNNTGIVGVYGISGSGKSSLLRAIAGFQKTLTGSIEYKNRYVLNTEKNQMPKVQLCSYMSQSPILFPHWTVKQNLDFAEVHSSINKAQTNELLLTLNCMDLLNHYPSQLSGGEKQRVAFIRALISSRNCDLILLDEPFSALDKDIKNTALALLCDSKKDKLIFLITHDINELYQYANNILLINNGTIQYQNNISKAMTSGQFQLPIACHFELENKQQVIYADDVSLSLKPLADSSIIHQIPVVIKEIRRKEKTVTIKLNSQDNKILYAKITSQSLDRLQLTLNQPVMANFKASSIT